MCLHLHCSLSGIQFLGGKFSFRRVRRRGKELKLRNSRNGKGQKGLISAWCFSLVSLPERPWARPGKQVERKQGFPGRPGSESPRSEIGVWGREAEAVIPRVSLLPLTTCVLSSCLDTHDVVPALTPIARPVSREANQRRRGSRLVGSREPPGLRFSRPQECGTKYRKYSWCCCRSRDRDLGG